jgi:hypothetical protein
MIDAMTEERSSADATLALQVAVSSLLDTGPADVLFWSGAGVSGDAPTLGPLGTTLTDRAIAEAFDGDLLDCLRQAYSALNLPRDRPRLEAVLDVVVAEHGPHTLSDLLNDLRDPPPNGNHHFFAAHTRLGGGHATANFDTCVERAGGDPDRIVHFHGSFSAAGGVDELGARVSGIERGFNRHQREALDRRLDAATVLVVVGYSGLDYFDVDPYWRDAAERGIFNGRRVVWINHAPDWGLLAGRACARKQLRIFADLGAADVYQVDAPTREVLNRMAVAWNMPPIPPPPPVQRRPHMRFEVTPTAKARATTRFLASAGLRGVVRQRLSGHQLTLEEHGWAADAAWGAGQYCNAALHWAQSYAADDPASRAIRGEREAACLWLRGRLRAARTLLLRTLDDAAEQGVDPQLRLLIAETLARVLAHMRRLPDTRLLVTRSSRIRAVSLLDDIEQTLQDEADGRSLPIHLRARVASARADLAGQHRPESGHEPIRDFDESEALGAMVNYQHAALRARAERRRDGDGGPPARWEYTRHRDRFRALGDTADAARVPLLPGAARVFPATTVVRDLARCDFTTYHLIRLAALHLFQRIRERQTST